MFDYTRNALMKVVNDFKKIGLGINISTQAFTIIYLIYALCVGSGVFVANVVLLTLASLYLAFFLYVTVTQKKKHLHKRVKEIYGWCKRSVKLLSIGITIYGLIFTSSNLSLFPLLVLLLTIVGWILEFLIYVIRKFIEAEIKLIIEGLKADYENIMKPVHTIKNFINKLKGKEEEPKKEPTKERAILDKILSKKKAETTRENLQKQTDAKSKFSLWMQDKLDIFTKKKKVDELENLETERIPAPVEEELAIEVTPPWEPEND